ncbi:GTP 3',8-cyclase MoaA [Terrimonas sp. NA20]|uniref:GTP 3',8-cyclase n=1 Tax=Terrimonas ginsenosidimutans TaxID=2908004 RepID=A0ABS9KMI7_9BACT|nr:GTP 3',8-cyclase MoaA [Terrimonas ginsenosidimutans]MCG2613533.1 GTP 3',8-cyclase MoaA [Terrimonas ginsenosidimutans]
MIVDTYDRAHTYLRISLTDLCNLRCAYCMPEEHYHFMPVAHLMQPAEIETIAKTFVSLGVNKIRLTGGEPLARCDFNAILNRLSPLPVELSLTTNATLLHRELDNIQAAGINSLNISLDTLCREKFRELTHRDLFDQTFRNIHLAIERRFNVKINMVVMKGVNENEILDFIKWTKEQPVEIRLIEFMPFAGNRWKGAQVFSRKEMLDLISATYEIEQLPVAEHSTSSVFHIPEHAGNFGVISTMSEPFCAGCNRMRLTADGKMKNCLFSKDETDLLSALRNGLPLEPLIRNNILAKAAKLGGQFGNSPIDELKGDELINRSMISIGG